MGTTCRLDEISYYKYCFQFTWRKRYCWTASSKCNTYGTISWTILWWRCSEKYSALIKDHLVIAADLVKAAKAGDQNAAAAIEKKWYDNGDEIVAFLTSINPYIDKEAFRKMFYEHLALTKAEALAFLNKDYEAGVKLYDKVEKEALEMSDMITNAIVQQFPQVFQ